MKVSLPYPLRAVTGCAAILLIALSGVSLSQDVRQERSPQSGLPYIADSLAVPGFVPPDRGNAKPTPSLRIEGQSHCRMENGKLLHILHAEPSALPDLESIRRSIREKEANPVDRTAQPGRADRETGTIILMGVTVFGNGVSHLSFPDGTGNTIGAVCGFDLSLLSGVHAFKKGGTDFSLLLTHGVHVASRDGNPATLGFPPLDVAPGAIAFHGGKPDAKTLSDLEILRDLIGNEKLRLIAFQKERRLREVEAAAWLAKNPLPPKDETIWLRPHTGSRYLAPDAAKPSAKGAAK